MPPSSARRRGTFGAFRRPFLTDPVFWVAAALAVGIGAVVSLVLVGLGGSFPGSVLSWSVAIAIFAVAGWLSFKLLAMGLNTSRALDETKVADEGRATAFETTGRTAGAVAGRGAAALMRRGRKKSRTVSAPTSPPAPTAPRPAAATPPPQATTPGDAAEPGVTVDNAARVLGSMLGRRLADRRKDDD